MTAAASSQAEKRSWLHAFRPKAPTSRWSMVLLIVSVGLLCLALLAYLARALVVVARASVLGFIAASPWIMLAAPVALIVAVAARHWYVVLPAAILTVLCVATQVPLFVAEAAPPNSIALNVMTSNLKEGHGAPSDVLTAVREHRVDVLMLEELTPALQDQLQDDGLDNLLPYHASDPRYGPMGTGLWSRYPLTNIQFPTGFRFVLITAQVKVPGLSSQPSLVALHMSGPVPYSFGWAHDIRRLPSVLQSLPTTAPVVVGGDFNATHDSRAFRNLLVGGYADAADQAGAGIVRSFPADRWYPPLIGIDHVLTRGGAVATGLRTVEIAGSDHRAVVVSVAVPREGVGTQSSG